MVNAKKQHDVYAPHQPNYSASWGTQSQQVTIFDHVQSTERLKALIIIIYDVRNTVIAPIKNPSSEE